jgi:iron complex outermembrane receptor protein
VQYSWNDSLMTYVSWSQGFKSGGFNQRFNAPPPGFIPISFDEEEAETYELGLKSEFGGVLRLNAAVFSTDYDNMQLIYRLGIVPLLFNAGKSSIDGAELEFTYAPGNLILEGSVGYLDDQIDEIAFVPGTSATVGPNNTLPFTPEWQGNLGLAYDLRLGSDASADAMGRLLDHRERADAANTRNSTARRCGADQCVLTLASGHGSWRLTAGVNNLTDELYPVAGNSSLTTASGYAEIIYSRPRTYFLTASYDF